MARPYRGQMGKAVEQFVARLGLTPTLGTTPPAGTSDEQTARWLMRSGADLLVVPFHVHRGDDETRLDGIGALLATPQGLDFSGRVVFMPVRAFSWTTSFQPRFEVLRSERPRLAEQLIVGHEAELASGVLLMRVRRALQTIEDNRGQTEPPRSSRSPRAPSADDAARSLSEQLSPSRRSPRRRATSGAWKFTLRDDEASPFSEREPSVPPLSEPRPVQEQPESVRPIYDDVIDDKKSSG